MTKAKLTMMRVQACRRSGVTAGVTCTDLTCKRSVPYRICNVQILTRSDIALLRVSEFSMLHLVVDGTRRRLRSHSSGFGEIGNGRPGTCRSWLALCRGLSSGRLVASGVLGFYRIFLRRELHLDHFPGVVGIVARGRRPATSAPAPRSSRPTGHRQRVKGAQIQRGSRRALILMQQASETIAANDKQFFRLRVSLGRYPAIRWREVQASMSPMSVVMINEQCEDPLKMTCVEDQQPVEALGTDGPHAIVPQSRSPAAPESASARSECRHPETPHRSSA